MATTSTPTLNLRVADAVAAALAAHGCDRAFHVPGESFLPLLDALLDMPAIDLVTCRHEGSAALAAVADSRITGRPGVVLVSRGPGLSNAMIGLHVAAQDAVPLVVLVGQVETFHLGRDAVQELDARSLGPLLKWSARVDAPGRTAETLARAFMEAASGCPGPVVVELPEDVLSMDLPSAPPRVHGVATPRAGAADVQAVAALLAQSRHPAIIAGGESRSDAFRRDLLAISEAWRVPVAVTNKQQDLFPNHHPHWAGHMGFFGAPQHRQLFDEADLVLAMGTRLGDLTTQGFTLFGVPGQALVQVHPDARQIGRHFATTLPVVAGAADFASQLAHVAPAAPTSTTDAAWLAQAAAVREALHGWDATRVPPADVLGAAVSAVAARLGPQDIVTGDSGNFAAWVHRILRLAPTNRFISSACGAMGMGVPAAVAAALRCPGRRVYAFCGDGGFLMNGNELAMAAERQLDVKLIVSNNRSYGTIRSYQQRAYPGRTSGTQLHNPDFVALARAYGVPGYRVDSAASASAVVEQALRSPGPVLIEVQCDADFTVAMSLAQQRGSST